MVGRLLLIVACLGCGATSSARRCEPTDGGGCGGAERCVVQADGSPDCVSGGADLAEGEACEAADDCADGMGCVRLFGLARCLRFCVPPEDSDADPCRFSEARTPADKLHRFGDAARCVASLPDRPDIGVCVLPCEPNAGDPACPCGLVLGLGMATCVEPGAAEVGQTCGVVDACAADLFCVPNDDTCRRPAGEAGCEAGRAVPIAGLRDPITFRDYEVCVEE